MNTGQIISLVGHTGLIGWLLFGGAWNTEPLPFDVTDVAVISEQEYNAMIGSTEAPTPATELQMPEAPSEQEASLPEAAQETPPEMQERPSVTQPEADPLPQIDTVQPPVTAEIEDTPPEITPPSEEDFAALIPGASIRPKLKPIERVAPEPVAQPEISDTRPDPEATPETAPSENAEIQKKETEASAPEEATTQIDPEARDDVTLAPSRSPRPRVRPQRSADTSPETSSAVNNALAEALGEVGGQEAAVPTGPPLTGAERDGLRLAVSRCWNVGALSTEALEVTIVVGVDMQRDGKPLINSINLISHENGSAAAAKQAYEAARRAIIRCGASGYDLPAEKYEQWKSVEIKFNPESMR